MDRVRVTRSGTSLRKLAILGAVVLGVVLALWTWLRASTPPAPASLPEPIAAPDSPPRASPVRLAAAAPKPAGEARPPEPAAPAPRPPPAPEQQEPVPGAGFTIVPGTPSGMALYPPRGSHPPRPGIVVPEDFEVPEGYLRHYQTTDDGRRLPAILMFHPDYEFLDASGVPIDLPEDRVVPPDLAPPDLPVEILEIPEEDPEAFAP